MKFTQEENSKILSKLVELRNVFQIGEKIVPMIQTLTNFMEEIVPLLNNVNSSINESTQKMPIAKNQIENVTNATELATTEILDLIDAAGINIEAISSHCNEIVNKSGATTEKFETLKEYCKDNESALKLIEEITESLNLTEHTNIVTENAASLGDKNFQMTMSLQVQDITSQQLAAVNHLINSVHQKLEDLINDIDQSQISQELEFLSSPEYANAGFDINPAERVTFDANASYARDDRQEKADEVIDKHSKAQASQDEIDKLFSSFNK